MCINQGTPNVQLGDEDQDIEYGMYAAEHAGNEEAQLNHHRINQDLLAGRRLQQNLIRNHFNA